MEVRNEEMKPYSDLSHEQKVAVVTAYVEGRLEYYHGLDREWYNTNMTLIGAGGIYRTKPKEEEQQMKETQRRKENSFPWHMIGSKWNAVARDSDYTSWTLYEEKPGYNGTDGLWYSSTFNGFTSLTETVQKVIGVDMSKWDDIPWEKSLMLRPGYQEKTEESNCDAVLSEEEADYLVNSVKEYPVVKMKELCNYTIGDVVRLKKTGELVEISEHIICQDCALYDIVGCDIKSNCVKEDISVYFKPVKEQ